MALQDFTVGPDDDDATPPDPSNPSNPSGGSPKGPGSGTGGGIPSISSIFGGQADSGPDAREFLVDMNARHASDDPILFRDEVVDQTIATLIGKDKPNALLIGHAGVGKTKVAEDIARRIAVKDPTLPAQLQGFTIYSLQLTDLTAGAGIVGQLEERVSSVIDFASDARNKAILFIDEIHLLMGDSQIYGKIAQQLKPALSRGRIRVIGATTVNEAQSFNDDPAMNRRFSRVIVDELTDEQTVAVLEKAWPAFASHYGHKVQATHELFEDCVSVANRFSFQGSHRPDSAITLLDHALADVFVGHGRQRADAQAAGNSAVVAALDAMRFLPVTRKKLNDTALRLMTGHARKREITREALEEAFEPLRGQGAAKATIIEKVYRRDRGLFPSTKPLTFLLAGPSGVGKTLSARIAASMLTDGKPIVLNMTEYNSPSSINRIIGSDRGYIGSESKAELPFDALDTNPYQVILLDEFEKCDRSVQRLFMRAFDEGQITTSMGKVVDFSKSIVFATTNAGNNGTHAARPLGFVEPERTASDEVTALSADFDLEFLNRFSEIVTYERIDRQTYRDIVCETYSKEAARINDEHGLSLPPELSDDDADAIVEATYLPDFGARPAENAVRDHIESIA